MANSNLLDSISFLNQKVIILIGDIDYLLATFLTSTFIFYNSIISNIIYIYLIPDSSFNRLNEFFLTLNTFP